MKIQGKTLEEWRTHIRGMGVAEMRDLLERKPMGHPALTRAYGLHMALRERLAELAEEVEEKRRARKPVTY
jgi:hypothetical protein